ncbi:MAG: segregation/condensation protein A [Gammaproteobacteria bacterium]|nr:segregation/condensation protein A [Gammaproteobacteria bacterium]
MSELAANRALEDETPELIALSPFATIKGQAVIDLPKDLYIPPDAMKVFLEAFEGPLDFLLYLIRKQNIDILDIPVASVTRQYMEYIGLMTNLSLELAAEYLVMAAILTEIKSRMLLPRPEIESTEEDPRAELVRRLQEYERYKQAAEDLDKLPRLMRDHFPILVASDHLTVVKPEPHVALPDLVNALMDVLKRAKLSVDHHISMETISVREKMTHILTSLQEQNHLPFDQLFNLQEGRLGIVVTFLAMLELLKQSLIEFVQATDFAPIYLNTKSA